MIPAIILEKMIAWHNNNGRRLVGIEWRPEINSVMAFWSMPPTLGGPIPTVHSTCYSIKSILGEDTF